MVSLLALGNWLLAHIPYDPITHTRNEICSTIWCHGKSCSKRYFRDMGWEIASAYVGAGGAGKERVCVYECVCGGGSVCVFVCVFVCKKVRSFICLGHIYKEYVVLTPLFYFIRC